MVPKYSTHRTRGVILGLLSGIVVVMGGAALGVGAVPPVSASRADVTPPTVQGTWLLTPTQSRDAAGFQMLSSFAAGNVFIETASNKPGTGLGAWRSVGSDGFTFTYLLFHFGPNGTLSNTVRVLATGTFHAATLRGQATYVPVDPSGTQRAPLSHFRFTGQRIAAASP